jgi:hypothetical protein
MRESYLWSHYIKSLMSNDGSPRVAAKKRDLPEELPEDLLGF